MSKTTTAAGSVAIEELTAEEGREMLERTAQERFGVSWDEFYAAYQAGNYIGTEQARLAEDLAFLSPFAG